jgi:F-type H+-transporting ATPase subunit delta
MSHDPINHAYAEAILRIAQAEGALPRVEEDAHRLADLLKTNAQLQQFIKNPNVRDEGKRAALAQLLGAKIHTVLLDSVLLIVSQNRGGRLAQILEEFKTVAANARQQVVGEVISAITLDEATVKRLEAELSKSSGRNVHLINRVDPKILGGLVVRLGHEVIDGSIRKKLEDVRASLSG